MHHRHAMSKKTTIYVLFKEYPDPNGRGKTASYIQDSADYLTQPDTLMKDWSDIREVLDYFCYEPANKYYDEDNLEGLLDVARIFPEEYPMALDTIVSEMQAIGLTPWRTNPCRKTDLYSFGEIDVTNQLLGDMAQRETNRLVTLQRIAQDTQNQLRPEDKEFEPCVLLQKGAVSIPHSGLQITAKRCVLKLVTVDSIVAMHNWLADNRFPVKHYKFHPKHGDANQKAQRFTDRHGRKIQAAQLLTDTPTTDNLLRKAVGLTVDGDLWYFDETNACHIYFENQGDTPQHEYHAYHLHPGEKNFEKIDLKKLSKVIL